MLHVPRHCRLRRRSLQACAPSRAFTNHPDAMRHVSSWIASVGLDRQGLYCRTCQGSIRIAETHEAEWRPLIVQGLPARWRANPVPVPLPCNISMIASFAAIWPAFITSHAASRLGVVRRPARLPGCFSWPCYRHTANDQRCLRQSRNTPRLTLPLPIRETARSLAKGPAMDGYASPCPC